MNVGVKWLAPCMLLGVLSGCGGSTMDPIPPDGDTLMVSVTGVVNGSFAAKIHVVENSAGSGFTTVQIVTGKGAMAPGLGIDRFLVAASILGEPETRHYDQMEGSIVDTMYLSDGGTLGTILSSQNRLYVQSIAGRSVQKDGSVLLRMHGMVAGSANSTENSDTVYFESNF